MAVRYCQSVVASSLVARFVAVGLIAAGNSGCTGSRSRPATTTADTAPFTLVVHAGAMKPVMREGKTEPRVRLSDAIVHPHLYAVGAMEGLGGEVTIADGEVWVSRVTEGTPTTHGPDPRRGDHAALLVGFSVDRWDAVPLTQALAGEDLEAAIEYAARRRGIDTTSPFPFLIEGEFAALDMHIISGFCPHGGGMAEAAHQPWKSNFTLPARARAVGIFARGTEGVLTHHGTAVHAHALVDTPSGLITGHIDAMEVVNGAVLLLPSR